MTGTLHDAEDEEVRLYGHTFYVNPDAINEEHLRECDWCGLTHDPTIDDDAAVEDARRCFGPKEER